MATTFPLKSKLSDNFSTNKITSKGQITLKKNLLQHLNLSVGNVVKIEKMADNSLRISALEQPTKRSFAEISGIVKNPHNKNIPFSVENIDEAIELSAVQAYEQGLEK